MNRITFILLAIIYGITLNIYGQEIEIDPMLIRFKGKVVNAEDGEPVPYAHVINNRTHGGTTTNRNGLFFLEMLNIDSLKISAMGFSEYAFRVPVDYAEENTFEIKIKPVRYRIEQVEITAQSPEVNIPGVPKGKGSDIDPDLRGAAYNSKPPLLSAIFNPVSFLQYYLSKKEKAKRSVRELMIDEARWDKLKVHYNKETVMHLTGLNEEEADDFMLYFNAKGMLNYTDSEYEVKAAIVYAFLEYKKEKGME